MQLVFQNDASKPMDRFGRALPTLGHQQKYGHVSSSFRLYFRHSFLRLRCAVIVTWHHMTRFIFFRLQQMSPLVSPDSLRDMNGEPEGTRREGTLISWLPTLGNYPQCASSKVLCMAAQEKS